MTYWIIFLSYTHELHFGISAIMNDNKRHLIIKLTRSVEDQEESKMKPRKICEPMKIINLKFAENAKNKENAKVTVGTLY